MRKGILREDRDLHPWEKVSLEEYEEHMRYSDVCQLPGFESDNVQADCIRSVSIANDLGCGGQ